MTQLTAKQYARVQRDWQEILRVVERRQRTEVDTCAAALEAEEADELHDQFMVEAQCGLQNARTFYDMLGVASMTSAEELSCDGHMAIGEWMDYLRAESLR